MAEFWSDRQVTHFVRETLGCGCPDEVFQKIEREVIAEIGTIQQLVRIAIGDKLLIYLARPGDWVALNRSIAPLVSAGRSDRDCHHYNRFRLVAGMVDPVDTDEQIEAERLFKAAAKGDEKLHLHFVSRAELKGF